MDIIQIYKDFGVVYFTEGKKHCRPGWVNVECPFCKGNFGYHLGFHIDDEYYVCYRCGWHPVVKTLSSLLRLNENEIYPIIKIYGAVLRKSEKKGVFKKEFVFPSNTEPLSIRHKRYLEKRGYDPIQLEKEWKLMGTNVFSKLDGIDYKHRIIIPFYWNGQVVSFDSRDITGKTDKRYNACPKERELIEHKRIVYGNQEKWSEYGICVEGPTDVWRFGPKAFCTSGIKYTAKQLEIISLAFKRVFIVYDDDPQAVVQARKLKSELGLRMGKGKVERISIEGDPGSMKQSEADYFVKQLIK